MTAEWVAHLQPSISVAAAEAEARAIGRCWGFQEAAATTRLLTRLLYEVKPMDVPTFGAVVGTVASVDPVESVRCE